jgi:uncharacterized membrane protein YoaK (UPF0700 family)
MMDFSPDSFRNQKHVLSWYGLAFQAGAINASGFLVGHSFVSHVTGIGTMVGIEVAAGRVISALELLAVPLSFLAGAMSSGVLIDHRKALGKRPYYPISMGLIFSILLAVFLWGLWGLHHEMVLVAALCYACGLQNASIVSATQGTVRTTHLTGILTDFGIYLIRNPHLKPFSKERYRQISINRIRLGTFMAFSAGSTLSAVTFMRFHYWGFCFPS